MRIGVSTPAVFAPPAREAKQAAARKTLEDTREIAKLAAVDRRVRAHELAHVAAGGPYVTSGPSYTFVKGPDGKQYAVAGQVQIDASAVPGSPEATMRKALTVIAAAYAPADPSPQDAAVAAAAQATLAAAQAELASRRYRENSGDSPADAGGAVPSVIA
jgi:hypothetical protein